ncbi:hypothetical protein [Sphingobacterium sp. JB170]|uniref:hypothetical protein n=1 Tax=Sphingobacterium sp. JB170 TaxID=1434842 RepID=UPI000B36444B|nr:hypothetical protein [Sphingobacterium sp. JB170]
MYTLLLGTILIASYLFYQSSTRVKFKSRPVWLERFKERPKKLRSAGLGLLFITLVACCVMHGVGAGIFGWIVYVMGMLCLLVLIGPYNFLKAKHIAVIFVISGLLELLYTFYK